MAELNIKYWYDYGSFKSSENGLRCALLQYLRTYGYVYIGVTTRDPKDRFSEHQRKWEEGHQWNKMIVIYQAKNLKEMRFAETELLKYARSSQKKYFPNCTVLNDKKSTGGEGSEAQELDGYWVYILLDRY